MVIKLKLLNRTKILGITLWPFIFVRPNVNDVVINHERIHIEQQKELLVLGFYILYLWWSIKYGYRNNPLEEEAYNWERVGNYMKIRKRWNYFKNNSK